MKKTVLFISLLMFSISIYARDWAQYSSEHLTIYSDDRPRKVRKLLNDIEVFREVTLQLFNFQQKSDNQKLVILLYKSKKDFEKIRPDESIAGYFYNSLQGPRMVVGPRSEVVKSQEILFHEYVHYLQAEHSQAILPRWYSEGLAGLLATFKIKSKDVLIGSIPLSRVFTRGTVKRLKVEDLIKLRPRVNSNSSQAYEASFYTTSWLLTHFITLSPRANELNLRKKLANFLVKFSGGVEPLAAFKESFDLSTQDFDMLLGEYANQEKYSALKFPTPSYEGEVLTQKLSEEEVSILFGGLLVSSGEAELAIEHFKNDKNISNPSALYYSLRALAHQGNNNVELAAFDANRVLQSEDIGSVALSNLGFYELNKYYFLNEGVENQKKNYISVSFELDTLLNDALSRALEAVKMDFANQEAHYLLGLIYEEKEDPINSLKSYLEAKQLMPSYFQINLDIARVLIQKNSLELARPYVESVIPSIHSAEGRSRVQVLLDNIDEGSVDINNFKDIF